MKPFEEFKPWFKFMHGSSTSSTKCHLIFYLIYNQRAYGTYTSYSCGTATLKNKIGGALDLRARSVWVNKDGEVTAREAMYYEHFDIGPVNLRIVTNLFELEYSEADLIVIKMQNNDLYHLRYTPNTFKILSGIVTKGEKRIPAEALVKMNSWEELIAY